MSYEVDNRQRNRGRGKGDSNIQQRQLGGSKGKGNARRFAPVGAAVAPLQKDRNGANTPKTECSYIGDEVAPMEESMSVEGGSSLPSQRTSPPQPTNSVNHEEELSRRMKEAEAEETVQRANECRLRQECNQAQEIRDKAKRAEARAREAAEDSQLRSERTMECLRNEIADLMKQVANTEKSQMDQQMHAKAYQKELDAMILSQATAMARRDELKEEAVRMEEQARTSEALATKEEANVKYLENKFKKEKERLEVVRAQADSLRREADDELASKATVQEEISQCQAEAELTLSVWRHLAAALGVAVVAAAFFRMF